MTPLKKFEGGAGSAATAKQPAIHSSSQTFKDDKNIPLGQSSLIVLDSAADAWGDLVNELLDLFWGDIVEEVGDEQSVGWWESVGVVLLGSLWVVGTLDLNVCAALRLNGGNDWLVLSEDSSWGDGDSASNDWSESLGRGLWDLKSETSEGEPG